MNAAVATAGALAWTMLFVTGCAGSFDADDLNDVFANLLDRQCLPEDFDSSPSEISSACEELVTGSQLPDECQAAPVLALFYNCDAASRGLIGDGSAPADENSLEEVIESIYDGIMANQAKLISGDGPAIGVTYAMIDYCELNADHHLTPRQTAVYAHLCLRWLLFADCDHKKEANGTLDAIGASRRVDFFLDGECPLSPLRRQDMFAVLTRIGGRTFEECGQDVYNGKDALVKYADTVPRVVCMLQDFQTDGDDNLDYVQLKNAIAAEMTGANSKAAELLLKVVHRCESSKTSVDFVKCWADHGIYDCIYRQANGVAAEFPDECHLSV